MVEKIKEPDMNKRRKVNEWLEKSEEVEGRLGADRNESREKRSSEKIGDCRSPRSPQASDEIRGEGRSPPMRTQHGSKDKLSECHSPTKQWWNKGDKISDNHTAPQLGRSSTGEMSHCHSPTKQQQWSKGEKLGSVGKQQRSPTSLETQSKKPTSSPEATKRHTGQKLSTTTLTVVEPPTPDSPPKTPPSSRCLKRLDHIRFEDSDGDEVDEDENDDADEHSFSRDTACASSPSRVKVEAAISYGVPTLRMLAQNRIRARSPMSATSSLEIEFNPDRLKRPRTPSLLKDPRELPLTRRELESLPRINYARDSILVPFTKEHTPGHMERYRRVTKSTSTIDGFPHRGVWWSPSRFAVSSTQVARSGIARPVVVQQRTAQGNGFQGTPASEPDFDLYPADDDSDDEEEHLKRWPYFNPLRRNGNGLGFDEDDFGLSGPINLEDSSEDEEEEFTRYAPFDPLSDLEDSK